MNSAEQALVESNKSKLEKLPRWKRFVVPESYLLGLILSLVIPENILEYRWAKAFTEFMCFLPFVRDVGIVTPVPATQFLAAVLHVMAIATTLYLLLIMLKYWTVHEYANAGNSVSKFKRLYLYFASYSFCPLGFYFLLIHNPLGKHLCFSGLNYRDKTMVGSMFGMGSYGNIIILGIWIFGIAIPLSTTTILIAKAVIKLRKG